MSTMPSESMDAHSTAPGSDAGIGNPAYSTAVVERFWSRVKKGDDCWLWRGARGKNGYGHLRYGGRPVYAHRFAWQLTNGPIPPGAVVRHECDTPLCVRPDHLRIGTQQDNVDDRQRRRRSAHFRGTHPRTKLTAADVRAMRGARSAGETYTAIAGRYGVDRATVGQICRGARWAHLDAIATTGREAPIA